MECYATHLDLWGVSLTFNQTSKRLKGNRRFCTLETGYIHVYCNVHHNHTIYLKGIEKVLYLNLLNCAVKLIMRKQIRKRIIK